MVQPIKRAMSIHEALQIEGMVLPEDTVNVGVHFPTDGFVQLTFTVNLRGKRLAVFGRAMERLSKEGA